ncbi:ABC transporter ATP-binding protein [Aequorivita echinoideorum]|uniref:ABC transporter ATP-binding protein n=1 Tax=Aequorivita echinoideorum TaxID=1549647 RepID=A0ABS5S5E0_9FLAO|nr:ABC transporter ATP-binding protein [Aequorivita echinoideorum]MBT0608438.1 ABC transporter ATP-binding protein [Aequorivita echinoideorum]
MTTHNRQPTTDNPQPTTDNPQPTTDNQVLIKVENLSKKFCKDLKTSLWYGVKDLVSGIAGNKAERELRPKEFWAVKDINFELRRGECLGLIGHNGAGKSTLLKILNGLINPDAGKVTIRGKVGALIELGAGFNPILSGRENIYNNGAVLGFTRKEIDAKVDEIIAFAELEEFIDMPVKNYSSGMRVRLGFAVAAQMEPDVLIIDEVLAVGDLGFVLKCFKRIDTILPNTAIVFVSHNMPMVSRICNKIILMDRGVAKFQGDEVGKAIDQYYTRFSNNNSNVVFDDGNLELVKAKLLGAKNLNNIPHLHWGDDFQLYLKFKINNLQIVPSFHVLIFDKEQRPVAIFDSNKEQYLLDKKDTYIEFNVLHHNFQLSKGMYNVGLNIYKSERRDPIMRINDLLKFQILHDIDVSPPFFLKSNFKFISNV